ncbi:hypothetical protein [Paenibacillus uliginis]|nr:hypothetical protein [Paenibacillus uliginis]
MIVKTEDVADLKVAASQSMRRIMNEMKRRCVIAAAFLRELK